MELQLTIFARCRIQDVGSLRLVSRGFRDLIDFHETSITREYLRLRRHGNLPSPIDVIYPKRPQCPPEQQKQQRQRHTREPEDDAILLSDLFPPRPPPSGRTWDAYTFGYLRALRRRQENCSQLAYFLADSVLEKYIHCGPSVKASFASKRDRQVFHDRGTAMLQFKLTPLMYVRVGPPILSARRISLLVCLRCAYQSQCIRFYVLFFLEMFFRMRQGLQDSLYAAFEAGKLPVPVQQDDRSEFYLQAQTKILHNPPFTDTRILVSTHHCMTLLVRYMSLGLAPEPPFYTSDDSLISMMLFTSPGLGRVVEYFAAEKGGGSKQRAMRRVFMRNMQADWDAARNDAKTQKVYGKGDDSSQPPPLRKIWFEAARNELHSRGVMRHQTDDWVEVSEGARINIGCQFCEAEDGWRA